MQVWIELNAWERALYPDVLQPEIKPFTTERLDRLKVAPVPVRLIIETLSHELEHSNENITSTISAQMSGFTCWLCLSLRPGHCSPLLLLFPALLDRLRSQKVIIFPYRSLSLKCFFFLQHVMQVRDALTHAVLCRPDCDDSVSFILGVMQCTQHTS